MRWKLGLNQHIALTDLDIKNLRNIFLRSHSLSVLAISKLAVKWHLLHCFKRSSSDNLFMPQSEQQCAFLMSLVWLVENTDTFARQFKIQVQVQFFQQQSYSIKANVRLSVYLSGLGGNVIFSDPNQIELQIFFVQIPLINAINILITKPFKVS